MPAIVDTSSLLSLVRYYLPFDSNGKLFDLFKSKFENGNLILIDAVYQECKYTSKGLVLNNLNYLNQKDFLKNFKIPSKTKDLLPPSPKKFYNLLNNNFRTRTPISEKLDDAEFEKMKKEYLETADARMIILALNKKSKNNDIVIVTEETEAGNDNKAFKKIPAICNTLKIKVMTLPELLKEYNEIDIKFI